MAKWQGRLQRTQILRGAAEILALDRELRACQPHEWRLHTLARRMLEVIGRHSPRPRVVRLVLKAEQYQHVDLTSGVAQPSMRYLIADAHIASSGSAEPAAIYPVPPEGVEVPERLPNLLDDPSLWTDPHIHANMVDFLRLDGMACWGSLEGPWQVHDRAEHVVHRAARAALACEQAHRDVLFWNPPFVIVGRPPVWGKSVDEVYVQPWRARYETLLTHATEFEASPVEPGAPPKKVTRRFLTEPEEHWTLELAWAIVKESRGIRLDCPPEVLPLSLLRHRGDLTIEQSVLQYLVDHPAGPGIRGVRAAELLGKSEGAVNSMLADIRRISDLRAPRPEEPEWEDWLAHKDALLFPAAMKQ